MEVPPPGCCAVEFVGDNLSVVDLFNGDAVSSHLAAQELVRCARDTLFMLWSTGIVCGRARSSQLARHVVRELDKKADSLATKAIKSEHSSWEICSPLKRPLVCMRFMFDGGKRGNKSSCGWKFQAAYDLLDGSPQFHNILLVSKFLIETDDEAMDTFWAEC